MKLKCICNRCGKRRYDTDVPKGKTIFSMSKKHKCRVRTRKRLNDFLPGLRVNGIKKFNGYYHKSF